ncbi:MAG: STAS domain-containing protein, partial [Xanthomonadales bacterium]|nr:STAS domain-containing protein [Xanthomonadales bacterium]
LYGEILGSARNGTMPHSLDLAEVRQIDSAGLALLLEWQSIFRRESGSEKLMAINNPPEALLKIARLCDAEHYLGGGTPSQGETETT